MNTISKVKALIKNECANYNYDCDSCFQMDGTCRFFLDTEEKPRCKYFELGVLPTNVALQNQYRYERKLSYNSEMLKCERCGDYIDINSNSQKYCDSCKKVVKRKQTKDRVKKHRGL